MIRIYEKNSSENLEFNANVFFKLFCSVQICWVEWVELGRVRSSANTKSSETIYIVNAIERDFYVTQLRRLYFS
jgi:hypothetical protein